MSRTYKTRQIPAHESKYLDNIKCCYCGRKTSHETVNNVGNWDNNPVYEFEQIIIRKEEGSRYPDTAWGEVEEWDICPNALKNI